MCPSLFLLLPEIILSYKGLSIACPAKICRENPNQDFTGKKFVLFLVTKHLKNTNWKYASGSWGDDSFSKMFAHKHEDLNSYPNTHVKRPREGREIAQHPLEA